MARHFLAVRAAILPALGLYACVWIAALAIVAFGG